MQYVVAPKEYHRGYCSTYCNSEESAIEQLLTMEMYTDFEWEIWEELEDDEIPQVDENWDECYF